MGVSFTTIPDVYQTLDSSVSGNYEVLQFKNLQQQQSTNKGSASQPLEGKEKSNSNIYERRTMAPRGRFFWHLEVQIETFQTHQR